MTAWPIPLLLVGLFGGGINARADSQTALPHLVARPAFPATLDSTRLSPGLTKVLPREAGSSHRVRNAVIGGAIGATAGILACTVVSNIAKDPGTGFSTCTTKGYLILGLGGLGIGAGIGAVIK